MTLQLLTTEAGSREAQGFCAPPTDASQAAPRLELLRRRGSIEQFGIVRRLHAFEISWRKRRG
jgi:hypothetical protein